MHLKKKRAMPEDSIALLIFFIGGYFVSILVVKPGKKELFENEGQCTMYKGDLMRKYFH